MTKILVAVAAFAAAALVQPAMAQTLYKSTLPNGRVIYGDRPAPGAVKVEESKPDTSNKGIGGTSPTERNTVRTLEQAREQREGGQDSVRSADQALKDAEAARLAGKEPLPGERIGTAGGASRLNESYFERQRSLDAAVEKARADLENARGR